MGDLGDAVQRVIGAIDDADRRNERSVFVPLLVYRGNSPAALSAVVRGLPVHRGVSVRSNARARIPGVYVEWKHSDRPLFIATADT